MFSSIRSRVTYANVAATLALLFAMTGGALAASKYLITSTKQIKPSVLKTLHGAAGAQGPAGPSGQQGAAGSNGKDGTNGTNGKDGVAGESVTNNSLAVTNGSGHCEEGGAEFKVGKGAATYACNGQTGYTEHLPSGKTLSGEWSIFTSAPASSTVIGTSVSFGIPLKTAPAVHYIRPSGKEPVYNATSKEEEEVNQPACPGSAASPKATPGNLCVYAKGEHDSQKVSTTHIFPKICAFGSTGLACTFGASGGDPYGFSVVAFSEEAGEVTDVGSWAVTAE